jgi:hypothetical protein
MRDQRRVGRRAQIDRQPRQQRCALELVVQFWPVGWEWCRGGVGSLGRLGWLVGRVCVVESFAPRILQRRTDAFERLSKQTKIKAVSNVHLGTPQLRTEARIVGVCCVISGFVRSLHA